MMDVDLTLAPRDHAQRANRPRHGERIVFDRAPRGVSLELGAVYAVRREARGDFYLVLGATVGTERERVVRADPRSMDRAAWRPATAREREAAIRA